MSRVGIVEGVSGVPGGFREGFTKLPPPVPFPTVYSVVGYVSAWDLSGRSPHRGRVVARHRHDFCPVDTI